MESKSKAMCRGCRDNYYNSSQKDGCWLYPQAKIVKRVQVGTWQPPPYSRNAQSVLSCYHCEGSSFLELTDCRIVGNGSWDKDGKYLKAVNT